MSRGSDDVDPEPAIVVARFDHGEADRILRLLTPGFGRVGVVAPRARRPNSPFVGLDLGVGVRVRWTQRGELGRLTEAEVVAPRPRLRESYERLTVAGYTLELIGSFAREGQPEPKLYGLLEMALLLLDGLDATFGVDFLAAVESKVLSFSGVCPRLGSCVRCGLPLQDPLRFSVQSGAYHLGCAPEEPGLLTTTAAMLHHLERLRRSPLRAAVTEDAAPDDAAVLEAEPAILADDLLYRCVVAQLGYPLRSRAAALG